MGYAAIKKATVRSMMETVEAKRTRKERKALFENVGWEQSRCKPFFSLRISSLERNLNLGANYG
jgi:hypothetical protein